MRRSITFVLLIIVTIFMGCSSSRKVGELNMSHLYQNQGVVVQPEFYVFQRDTSLTDIYFRLSTDQLLYSRDPESGRYEANLLIQYRLYNSLERTNLVDSGSVWISDIQDRPGTRLLTGKATVKTKYPLKNGDLYTFISLTDVQRKLTYSDILTIQRSDPRHQQNFLMKDTAGHIIFNHHSTPGRPFYLEFNRSIPKYWVAYHSDRFPLPAPPYVENAKDKFSLRKDSIYEVDPSKPITLSKPGFYQFRVEKDTRAGFTAFNFNETFPYIGLKDQLGGPLRYLTTNEEYSEISGATDDSTMKYMADAFWLRNAGSIERGQYLVEQFYSRVESANKFFTSFVPGWKTDRGLVYIIFGPPSAIYKDGISELWIYGNENSSLNHNYTFVKVNNPFTENDYQLKRKSEYRYGWGRAIEAWRNGQVYSVKEIKREQDERDQSLRTGNPYLGY
ncbi:MAG: GWxTD domain-containing protein [Bacteroidota bacterium]|nr:GWxTD domain-containing protein [Bacteroidota bacterium]MDX5504564.1 GWxTD domain-containing protein [Bacteroidota bacterium]